MGFHYIWKPPRSLTRVCTYVSYLLEMVLYSGGFKLRVGERGPNLGRI